MSAVRQTRPVGLCGELMISRRVFGVIAAASLSKGSAYSGASSDTNTGLPPASSIAGT